MSTLGDGLDLDEEDLDDTPAAPPPPAEPPADLTPEQKEIADLKAQITSLRSSASSSDDKMARLLELGEKFVSAQAKPDAPVDNSAAISAFGKKFQEAIISGTPEDVATLFLSANDNVTKARLNEAITKFGTPMAEKSGTFAVQAFLAHKKDEAGTNGEPTHNLVAKKFALEPDELAYVATASGKDTEAFLNKRYREIAGDVLLTASKKPRAPKLDGGSSGGASGGNVTTFPGVDVRRARELEKLAEQWWPDKAVREQKLKTIAAEMAAGA